MNTHHSEVAMPAASEPRRRIGGRSARIQAAVFEVTIRLLQERGYEAFSFATIGELTGVHETTLYRRWKTKEHLVAEATAHLVEQDIPIPDTGAFRSDLIQLLQSLRLFMQSATGQAIIQVGLASRNVPAIGALSQRYWQRRNALIRPLFERAIARGELSPQTDLSLLFEMLIGVFYVRFSLLREPMEEALPERIADLVLLGVGGLSPPQ